MKNNQFYLQKRFKQFGFVLEVSRNIEFKTLIRVDYNSCLPDIDNLDYNTTYLITVTKGTGVKKINFETNKTKYDLLRVEEFVVEYQFPNYRI